MQPSPTIRLSEQFALYRRRHPYQALISQELERLAADELRVAVDGREARYLAEKDAVWSDGVSSAKLLALLTALPDRGGHAAVLAAIVQARRDGSFALDRPAAGVTTPAAPSSGSRREIDSLRQARRQARQDWQAALPQPGQPLDGPKLNFASRRLAALSWLLQEASLQRLPAPGGSLQRRRRRSRLRQIDQDRRALSNIEAQAARNHHFEAVAAVQEILTDLLQESRTLYQEASPTPRWQPSPFDKSA